MSRHPLLTGLTHKRGAVSPVATLIYDTFTDSDGTALASHTIAPTNTVSASWSVIAGAMQITSNRAYGTINSSRGLVDVGIANFKVSSNNFKAAASSTALYARYQDANNYLVLTRESGALRLYKVDGGVVTLLLELTVASMTNGVVKNMFIDCDGSDITIGGGSPEVTGLYSTAFMQTKTKAAIDIGNDTNNYFDDFTVEAT